MDIFYSITTFLVGLGVLLFSVKALGESLEKTTGARFRQTVAKMANNRFSASGLGTTITLLLQSSTASMAMFVALCNAGIVGLTQAVSVVLGVNIGSAITHIIVLFGSVKVLQLLSLILVVGSFIMIFAKSAKIKNVGRLLFSIGLLFLSITLMSQGMSVLNEKGLLDAFITSVSNPILLILVFALFTCVIQTSMGAMMVLITLIGGGTLAVHLAPWAVMGINIGTSVSTMLVTMGASINSRRTGLVHVMFNIIGTIIFGTLMALLPIGRWLAQISSNAGIGILIFDLGFNILTALLLIGFVKYITKLMQIIFKEPKRRKVATISIDESVLDSPSVALPQVLNSLIEIYTTLSDDFFKSIEYLFNKNEKLKAKIASDCIEIDKADDLLEKTMIRLSSSVSEGDQEKLTQMLDIVHKNRTIIRKINKILFYASRWDSKRPQFNQTEAKYIHEMCFNIMSIRDCALFSLKNIDSAEQFVDHDLVVKVLELDNNVDNIKNNIRTQTISNIKSDEKKKEKFTTYSNIINAIEDVSEVFTTITIIATEKE